LFHLHFPELTSVFRSRWSVGDLSWHRSY